MRALKRERDAGMFGAEYRPRAANVEHPAEKGIKWLKEFKKA